MTNTREKAVIYARVSSREQETTGYSLPAQQELLERYAAKEGLDIVRIFSVAESASSETGRKTFQAMLEYVVKQSIPTIICEKTDRLTRKPKDAVVIDEWVENGDARSVHFVKESFVLNKETKAHEHFMWNLKVAVAKLYTDNLSEEVKKGQRAKVAQGWYPKTPPLGYKSIEESGHKIHALDETTSPVLRGMFNEYASGRHTISSITEYAKKSGLRTKRGGVLARSCIERTLKNPFYCGKFRWDEVLHTGKHPALVTEELFNKVQDIMHGRNTGKVRKHNYLFKGSVKCKDCGGTITWEKQKGIIYGHCSQYRGCVKRSWYKEADFVFAVQEQLEALNIVKPRLADWVRKALKEIHASEITEKDATVQLLQSRQNALRQRLDVLYNDRLDNRIKASFYDEKAASINHELDEVVAAIGRQTTEEKKYYELGETLLELSQRASEIFETAPPERQRKLLSLLCREMYVEDGQLVLHFTPEFKTLKELALRFNSSKMEEVVVSPYQIFELEKEGSNKALKGISDTEVSILRSRRDSNPRGL